MKKVFLGLILLLMYGPGYVLYGQVSNLAALVYPQLDTDNSRWFYFASACRPFGMVDLIPDTQVNGAWASGYVYTSNVVHGFSHIHAWQLSGLSVMPVTFKNMEDIATPFQDCSSTFSHDTEVAEVGYHRLTLDRYGIDVELSSTCRTALHHYVFNNEDGQRGILFNLNTTLGPCKTYDGTMMLVDRHIVEGEMKAEPTFRRPKPVSIYFYAELDEDVDRISKHSEGGNYMLILKPGCKEITMKIGLSYTSIENAKRNLMAENPGRKSVRDMARESQQEWNSYLSRIQVEGGTSEQQRRFYTDLWHALLGRHIISDVNGAYPNNMGETQQIGQIPLDEDGKPQYNMYNSDSFWGAQWTLNTLWGLAYPDIYHDFVCSLMQYYRDGGMIPRGPSGGNYTYVMTGSSATPFIVSAIQKGIVRDNLPEIYQALRKNHELGGMMDRGRYEHNSSIGGGMKYYTEKGYIPYPIPEMNGGHTDGAGLTLENEYQDWTLAQLAKRMGYQTDYKHYMQRSLNYGFLFDKASGWMRPRDVDGNWLQNFDPFEPGQGFVESSAAQGTWYVPQDGAGLAKLMGGKDVAAERLDSCFREAEKLNFTSGTSHEVESNPEFKRIPVNYGNQPSTHIAFMFYPFGRPDLAQYWSRKVIDKAFSGLNPHTGYNGDEDQGMMGSLSVLMKIGLFQLNGGTEMDPVYQIGSPIFDKVTIHLNPTYYSDKTFEIINTHNSNETPVVKKALLNGKRLKSQQVRHSSLIKGGKLELKMQPTNK